MTTDLPLQPEEFRKTFEQLRTELATVIVGQGDVVELLLVAFFAGGHVLLEGVPGLGKTLLAKSFAKMLGLSFRRLQCTPDLMPADIIGTELVVDREGRKVFEFAPGPVFTHILLADEINRATPKTQSALLEAMAEQQVTVSGKTYQLEEPFFVIGTQNPIEMEGSLPLGETVLVNGRPVQGSQLLKEARQRGAVVRSHDGKFLYTIPGLWTWTLSPEAILERQPCQLYALPYRGSLFSVRTKTGREIRVTADHPFLVNAHGEIRWRLAKDLTVGEYLVTPASLAQYEEHRELLSHEAVMHRLAKRYRVVRHEELLDIMTRSEQLQAADCLTARELDMLRIASRLSKRQLAQRLRLSRRGYWQLVRFFRRNTANAQIKSALVRYFSAHRIDLSEIRDFVESYSITALMRFPVTPEVAGWLAFLLSDGTVGRGVVAAFQKNYPKALDAFIRTTRDQLGVDISEIRHAPSGRTVVIRSKPLVDYLRLRFGVTRSGVIPYWMATLPQTFRRSFLRTFISLESHCDLVRHRITFVQKRRAAVNVIMHMLLLEGILSWVRKRRDRDIYELKIQGGDFKKFLDQIGWIDGQVVKGVRFDSLNGYSPFRVVPVSRDSLVRVCDLLGVNSFHTAKDRTSISTRPWYQAYRFGRKRGIVSQAKLREFIEDIQREINLRQRENLDTLVVCHPRKAARLCGFSLVEVAKAVGVSKNVVWKTYISPRTSPHPAISACIKQEFQNRLEEVERLLNGLRRLSQVFYDAIEHIDKTPFTGQVFGLTVPQYQNYVAGFGACGISHNTYPLPEAQLDRFLFRIFITYPSSEELGRILRQTTVADLPDVRQALPGQQAKDWILNARRLVREVLVAKPLEEHVVRLVSATHPTDGVASSTAQRFIRYGASPRGAQAIFMGAKALALVRGRVNVSFEDIDRVILSALNHRLVLSFEAEAERRTATEILRELTDPLRAAR